MALAAQLKPLSLVEALCLLPLIAEHEPRRFEAAAVAGTRDGKRKDPSLDLTSSGLALTALSALRGPRRREGLRGCFGAFVADIEAASPW